MDSGINNNKLFRTSFLKTPKDKNSIHCSVPSSPLTRREIQVLQMAASGLTNTEISRLLNISSHTVKSHMINIFNKVGVNDRTQASVWAVQNNLF